MPLAGNREKESAVVVAALGLKAKIELPVPGLQDVWRRDVLHLLMSAHSERPGTIPLMFSLSSSKYRETIRGGTTKLESELISPGEKRRRRSNPGKISLSGKY